MAVISFSDEQSDKARHALGLGRQKVAYRNHYACYEADPDWEDLVKRGFATKRTSAISPDIIYHVSEEARHFFTNIGESIGDDVRFPKANTPPNRPTRRALKEMTDERSLHRLR